MTLNPVCENVETAQGVPLTVTGVAQVKIMKNPELLHSQRTVPWEERTRNQVNGATDFGRTSQGHPWNADGRGGVQRQRPVCFISEGGGCT